MSQNIFKVNLLVTCLRLISPDYSTLYKVDGKQININSYMLNFNNYINFTNFGLNKEW